MSAAELEYLINDSDRFEVLCGVDTAVFNGGAKRLLRHDGQASAQRAVLAAVFGIVCKLEPIRNEGRICPGLVSTGQW